MPRASTSSAPRASSLSRRLRSLVGQTMRRMGWLPGGQADGLGEDEALLGQALPYEVMVFFADTPPSLYQVEQWYETFQALAESHPLGIVVRDSRVARSIQTDSGLPVHTIARFTTIDDLLTRSPTKLALYVNHNPENFGNLKFGRLAHVTIGHGDSDKTVSVTNQLKGYDFVFVAGQAAADRIAENVMFFDAAARCVAVGQPQTERQVAKTRQLAACRDPRSPTTILYAPSWEDALATSAYGSLESHGPRLIQALLDSGRYRVVYRPHPMTGVRVPSYGDADAEVRRLVAKAAAEHPTLGHRVDAGIDISESFADADLLICDISGVAIDWLPLGKPLIVTTPAGPVAQAAESALTRLVPRLPVSGLDRVLELVQHELQVDPGRAARAELAEYYLGDTSPGSANRRFIAACERVMALRDGEVDRLRMRL